MARLSRADMAAAEDSLRRAAADLSVPRAQDASGVGIDDPEWITALVHEHLRRVVGLLFRMVGNHADAQDLAQEVFLKAYQRRGQLRERDRALGWLLRIATNTAIDFQRVRSPERTAETWNEELALGPPGATPEQQYLRSERDRRLHEALRRLAPRERAALVLRDIEGWSGPEVAAALGCSKITVRTHIAAARIKLRRFLSTR